MIGFQSTLQQDDEPAAPAAPAAPDAAPAAPEAAPAPAAAPADDAMGELLNRLMESDEEGAVEA